MIIDNILHLIVLINLSVKKVIEAFEIALNVCLWPNVGLMYYYQFSSSLVNAAF